MLLLASSVDVAKYPTMHETASTTEKCPATGVNSLRLRNAGVTPQNLPLWLKVSPVILFLNTPQGGITKDSHCSPQGGLTVNLGIPPSQFAERELRDKSLSVKSFLTK